MGWPVHRTGKLLQITCCFIGVLILEQACCARTLELIFRATLSGYIFIYFLILLTNFLSLLLSLIINVFVQRNYRFFYMFVFSTTLLCLYVFAFCWVYVIKIRDAEQLSLWKALLKTPASIVLIIYCFLCVWFVGGLSVFHLYLMSTNQVGPAFIPILIPLMLQLQFSSLILYPFSL